MLLPRYTLWPVANTQGLGEKQTTERVTIQGNVRATVVLYARVCATCQFLGSFLERPGNLTGPESYFEIKVSRKVGAF